MTTRKRILNAAQWRKRLRHELLRAGADGVSLYVDGPRATVRMRFPSYGAQATLGLEEALDRLRSVPDGAGVEQTAKLLDAASTR